MDNDTSQIVRRIVVGGTVSILSIGLGMWAGNEVRKGFTQAINTYGGGLVPNPMLGLMGGGINNLPVAKEIPIQQPVQQMQNTMQQMSEFVSQDGTRMLNETEDGVIETILHPNKSLKDFDIYQ